MVTNAAPSNIVVVLQLLFSMFTVFVMCLIVTVM
jgi:hypothetical protein